MAGVTTLWHLERKPSILMLARLEASHCFSRLRGKRTCMSPHEMRPDSPVETPEEPRETCQHWRGNLRFPPQLQMRTAAMAATGKETRETPHNSRGDFTFWRPQEQVPEVPVVTRGEPQVSCCNSIKNRRFSPPREMRPFSAVASQEKSHLPS